MMKAAEASGKTTEERRAERRQKAVVGPLPESFLRIPGIDDEPMTAEERDREMAIALQRQLALEQQDGAAGATGAAVPTLNQNVMGRLTITVVEAKLTKNYGVTRMDPYARLRVGHNVYETPTCQNGAREPKWNKTINCFLMAGSKTIDVEIYDECTFSPDSLIAHAAIPLTERVLDQGEMVDDWWPLSGQEGEEKEGMIHLILSMQNIPPGSAIRLPTSGVAPSMSGGKPMSYTTSYVPPPVAAPPALTEEDLEEFSKMFPAIDKAVIEAVFVESRGDKEATVNALLQLGS
eukprot:TRINITY_DN19756_c0_g1_i1.p1 TRINITY_DN19756_c0_g1~~TRINITY_DN19756_c0_g1_i1.p1  ORF type:complete len:292 (-),score=117.23 TRINITY_DN19756_c0_g1_i1:759-1634(-)